MSQLLETVFAMSFHVLFPACSYVTTARPSANELSVKGRVVSRVAKWGAMQIFMSVPLGVKNREKSDGFWRSTISKLVFPEAGRLYQLWLVIERFSCDTTHGNRSAVAPLARVSLSSSGASASDVDDESQHGIRMEIM